MLGEKTMNSREFGDKYLTREEKEEALKQMTDEEIEELIRTQENLYGKIFYAKYLKKNVDHRL